jgi:four helix bundle protein
MRYLTAEVLLEFSNNAYKYRIRTFGFDSLESKFCNLESGIWNLESRIISLEHCVKNQSAKELNMRYQRFEDLPVWNSGIDLALRVYEFTARPEFDGRYSLKDQLERAAVSVSNNIAEGFERGTNKALLSFLYISRGSAGEVRSMLCLIERMPSFKKLKADIKALKDKAESCSRQLKAWAQALQNSDFKGERHVNQKMKRAAQAAKEREEFLNELAEIRAKGKAPNKNIDESG